MPRGDRTGPAGEGPLTGRQLGYGAGYDSPGYTKGAAGRVGRGFWGRGGGFGPGYGRGFFRRAWGRGFNYWKQEVPGETEMIKEEGEMKRLRSEVTDLKDHLRVLMERIESLSSDKKDK